jgi:hypothetical protein
VVLQRVQGGQPGLYGGSQNDKVCDVAQLVKFLQENADKARAWAQAQGIEPSAIADFIGRLTPVLLRVDTRVTNYGYDNGRPVARQAILQAGTAVLVDDRGVPRARCKCGNPLGEPQAVTQSPVYTGDKWPGFDPAAAQVTTPAPQPLGTLVLTDPANGEQFERPVGTSGEADAPVSTTTPAQTTTPVQTTAPTQTTTPVQTTTAVTATTTPVTTATTAVQPATTTGSTPGGPSTTASGDAQDVTARGEFDVSSEFPGGKYPASLAFDGDATTSWFSAGDADSSCTPITPGASCSDLVWVHREPVDVLITWLEILNNSEHPDFPSGFGFGSVTIEITNLAGVIVHTETILLPGDDPDIGISPGVRGHSVHLVFEGHDDPGCGGIAEFSVLALP